MPSARVPASCTVPAQVPDLIDVQVVYSLPPHPPRAQLRLPAGSSVGQAIELSGLLEQCPEIDLAVNAVGVFGRRCALTQVLRAGDRVEIYRALVADPKDSRRRRVSARASTSRP